MDVTKNQYDKELQKMYYPGKVLSGLTSIEWGIKLFNYFASRYDGKNIESLHSEEIYIQSEDNEHQIRLRIFKPKDTHKVLPAMLYLHGGGYEMGNPELSLGVIESFIKKRPCVVVAPDYRLSIDHPFPAGFNDCYDTLLWMKNNALSINIRPSKFVVAGHSAGGGMTAAVTLKARDTQDVDIAFQMPIYPMLDYRQETTSAREFSNTVGWNTTSNKLAWELYLKDVPEPIPSYASPSLNQDYSNFPPTITFVGDLEPFKDETIAYVKALKKADIPVKFELYKGAFHGFETAVPDAIISKKANKFQFNSFAEYFDKYIR